MRCGNRAHRADFSGRIGARKRIDSGTLSVRLIASHVTDQLIDPSTTNPTPRQDIAGTTGSTHGAGLAVTDRLLSAAAGLRIVAG
ncbi:MAG: hypothetical protein JXB36_05485 [Gammaproteobacteria bacterium]|nr:hypothetical protein [Gammaproteobacteria bacterium]